jgi:tellurite resistance protein TerC
MIELFPFSEYWWFYLAFVGLVLLLLALDLGVFHRKAHTVRFREAAIWSLIWITLALLFCFLLYQYALWKFPQDLRLMAVPGFDPAAAAWLVLLEFLTGYLVEKSLSVDNIFVFVMVFGYFSIPAKYQHRVLFYGILGALVFRAIFVALGSALMRYHWVILFFGVFLIFTGIKIFLAKEKEVEPEKNLLIRVLRRLIPVTQELHAHHFFARRNRRLYATPLLLCVVFLEATDIVFAIDSVPAIFALTNEPLIVFTSNIFAILGLRALYFMLAGAVDKFHLLKYGLGAVLIFVGLKMVWLNELFGGKFPIVVSLGIIAAVIAASVVLSLTFPKAVPEVTPKSSPSSGANSEASHRNLTNEDRKAMTTETSETPSTSLVTRKRVSHSGRSSALVGRSQSDDQPLAASAQLSKYNSSGTRASTLSDSTVRLLWKVLGFYLALVGLSLIAAAAMGG